MTLAEKMTAPAVRGRVVRDLCRMLDEEVASKGGLSGFAVKGGYAMVKAVKPGFVAEVVEHLLNEWVAKLEPMYAAWQTAGGGKPFSSHLGPRQDEVAELLLAVTDEKAGHAKNGTVRKMYEKLRPSAKRHVADAVPRLGRLIDALP